MLLIPYCYILLTLFLSSEFCSMITIFMELHCCPHVDYSMITVSLIYSLHFISLDEKRINHRKERNKIVTVI